MQLGEAGEAVFIEDDTANSLPSTRHLEPSNSNTFIDPDNCLLTDSQPQLSNIDLSPQIINKQIDEQKSHENHESVPKYAYEQPAIPSIDIDVLNSNTTISNRRRQKRRSITNKNKPSSEEEDQEVEKIFYSTRRRSRGQQRDLTAISLAVNLEGHNNDEEINKSSTFLRKRSASENDMPLFPIDDDKESESSTPFVDAHSRMNSIDSRKKLLIIPPKISIESDDDNQDDQSYSSSPEESSIIHDEEFHEKTKRTLSNPIPIEQKTNNNNEELNTLINDIFSQSAPLTNNLDGISVRMSKSSDPNSYYLNENFSPSSSFER